jgi:hypothetical protein
MEEVEKRTNLEAAQCEKLEQIVQKYQVTSQCHFQRKWLL